MLYIEQVQYKINKNSDYKNGWLIGYDKHQATTLLDENFNHLHNTIEVNNYGVKKLNCYNIKKSNSNGIMINI